MSEIAFADEVVTSALVTNSKENIASRKTVVYQTRVDPTVARIAAEKNKHKLFSKFLFKLNEPEEIEYVSTEKYYEPYIVVSGKYFIDYYRKCAYAVRVAEEAREVILFDHTFIPEQASNSTLSERSIKLEGEERIVKETSVFLLLDRDGQDSKVTEFPSAPSEENPQELIKSFKMPEIAPDMDVEVIRKRIAQRPIGIKRIVSEVFEIGERSIIYTPVFKFTYKCPKLGKEAYLEFDGVTSKLIRQNENVFSAAIRSASTKLKGLFNTAVRLIP